MRRRRRLRLRPARALALVAALAAGALAVQATEQGALVAGRPDGPHPVRASSASGGAAGRRDPVRSDPDGADGAPSMAVFTLDSAGARTNGIAYLAAGKGPHPVVVLLHGYPGNERNLDLAQAMRRAGWDVVVPEYRGAWGSGGTFTLGGALADVGAALAWVREPANAARLHLDPSRVALVGHSFGGWLALLQARREPPAVCVGALAAWNLGWDAARLTAHPEERAAALAGLREGADPASGPLRADAEAMLREIEQAGAGWDYRAPVAALRDRSLLLVAATHDDPDEDVPMHRGLAEAVRAAGGRHVALVTFDDDHPFSAHRLGLADAVVRWLDGDCAARQRELAAPAARRAAPAARPAPVRRRAL